MTQGERNRTGFDMAVKDLIQTYKSYQASLEYIKMVISQLQANGGYNGKYQHFYDSMCTQIENAPQYESLIGELAHNTPNPDIKLKSRRGARQ